MNIKTKIKDSRDHFGELKSQLARALADYDNLRKRTDREKEDFEKIANIKLIIKLLPVLDTIKQAQIHLKDGGLAIIISQFEDALKSEEIEEITPVTGGIFDENIHEATEVLVTSEVEKRGKIAEVVLPGWKFKDGPVIRYAIVKVFGKDAKSGGEPKKESIKERIN